jgi:hypothetical protein
MQALEFWKAVTVDHANLLESLIRLLHEHKVKYCVIEGQAVNAYAEQLTPILRTQFVVEEFPHRLNVSTPGSQLCVQIQTDPKYLDFPDRAERREVLGLELSVASLGDLLQGKVWAASDPTRRATKRQKDILDIARLIEKYPHLRPRVPANLLKQIAS